MISHLYHEFYAYSNNTNENCLENYKIYTIFELLFKERYFTIMIIVNCKFKRILCLTTLTTTKKYII